MYRQPSTISTSTEALDELADVHMTLNGLSALTLALATSDIPEPDAMRLTSCLLDYCALTTEAASHRFDEEPSDATQLARSL